MSEISFSWWASLRFMKSGFLCFQAAAQAAALHLHSIVSRCWDCVDEDSCPPTTRWFVLPWQPPPPRKNPQGGPGMRVCPDRDASLPFVRHPSGRSERGRREFGISRRSRRGEIRGLLCAICFFRSMVRISGIAFPSNGHSQYTSETFNRHQCDGGYIERGCCRPRAFPHRAVPALAFPCLSSGSVDEPHLRPEAVANTGPPNMPACLLG